MKQCEWVLEVKNLYKKIDDFMIEDINITLEPGYIMGLIGRNGSGKTTIMKLIQNVIIRDKGNISICGYDNVKNERKAKNEIGFIMEDCPFIERYTLMENAQIFGLYYQKFSMEDFISYLKKFSLNEADLLMNLSKGMVSKFQLAFALSHKPKLLILDEPTDGLDPVFRIEFLSLLQELIESETMSVLFSTHITTDLDKVADFITMIDNGRIVFTEDKETLLAKYSIIKGDLELLKSIPSDMLIGIRRLRQGFEGLVTSKSDIKNYCTPTSNIIMERATLSDILYYMNKRGV